VNVLNMQIVKIRFRISRETI